MGRAKGPGSGEAASWAPSKEAAPASFAGIDFYPALTFRGSLATARALCDLEEVEDGLGRALAGFARVGGILLMLARGERAAKNEWTLFADMGGCVRRGFAPTAVGQAALRALPRAEPTWLNHDGDEVWRQRTAKAALARGAGAP